MSNRRAWSKGLDAVLNMLLPPRCVLCGSKASTDSPTRKSLCVPCHAALPSLGPACPCCAHPTPGGQVCGECLKHPPHFDTTLASHPYRYPLDRVLQRYKYQPDLHVLGMLQGRLAELAIADEPEVDIVIAVPSTPGHLRTRGFNPALELARPIAAALNKPLRLDVCQRPVDAPAQASLPWKLRRSNLKNAFTCSADLSGLHVLVVDDVMTTGATLDALAHKLKRHGAARVSNVVVARAVRDAAP